ALGGRGGKSELHAVGALEAEHVARFLRGRDLEAQLFGDAAYLGDLLGIALGELAGADIEAVLEADAHIAAEHGRHGAEIHLVAAAGKHRPQIIVAEQAVGGALHVEEVVEVGADAAEDTEDELQEHRGLEQAAVDAVGEIVEVAGVIALVLELDAVAFAQRAVDLLDV